MHQVVEPSPADDLARPTWIVFRVWMTDGYRADRRISVGHAIQRPEVGDQIRWNPEEQRTKTLIDHREQHQQGGEAGVNVPVWDWPVRLVPVGPALVVAS